MISSVPGVAQVAQRLRKAVCDDSPVAGLTHAFYRYPARFSPQFARAAIAEYTEPGDLVFDPFMGGGTTLVEAKVAGRRSIGSDISELAVFVSKVKTTPLNSREIGLLQKWGDILASSVRVMSMSDSASEFDLFADRHLRTPTTWRARHFLSQAATLADALPTPRTREFARCVVLRTGQWALDGRKSVPTTHHLKERIATDLDGMLTAMTGFSEEVRRARREHGSSSVGSRCLLGSAEVVAATAVRHGLPYPRLILTSPPYPGTHMLYHRWQVEGRRETDAPFWLTQTADGHAPGHYTFANRWSIDKYFDQVIRIFSAISAICTPATRIVQLVGFNDVDVQLPRYLEAMQEAGFVEEVASPAGAHRVWRQVPGRKWHARQQRYAPGAREVLLIHSLQSRI
jgi:hypothetical protein